MYCILILLFVYMDDKFIMVRENEKLSREKSDEEGGFEIEIF